MLRSHPGLAHPPGYHSGGCPRLLMPTDWCPVTDQHRRQLSASSPPAPCPSRRDSLPHGFHLICLCNELGVCNEPGRVISKRWLVLASLSGLCRSWCHVQGGTRGSWGTAPMLTPHQRAPAPACRGPARRLQRAGWGTMGIVLPTMPLALISLPGCAAPSPVLLSPA